MYGEVGGEMILLSTCNETVVLRLIVGKSIPGKLFMNDNAFYTF